MIDFTGKTYFSILKAMLDQIPNTYDKRDTSPIPTALALRPMPWRALPVFGQSAERGVWSRPPWGSLWTIWQPLQA